MEIYIMNSNRLPSITIRPDAHLAVFLARIGDVAEDQGYSVRKSTDIDGETPHLVLDPPSPIQHDELKIVFSSSTNAPTVISVWLSAKQWADGGPSEETYLSTVHEHVQPILRAYNKKWSSRRKLAIRSGEQLLPTLPPLCQHA